MIVSYTYPQAGFKCPIPTSTSSPAPTMHELGGPLRRRVGASGERMWGVGPCGRPSGAYVDTSGEPSSGVREDREGVTA